MIYTIIKEDNGKIYSADFENLDEYRRYFFNPTREVLFVCDTETTNVWGKTREEKKNIARKTAIRWQSLIGGFCPSYWDFMIAEDYFTALGRRYGLLREFRENGIC